MLCFFASGATSGAACQHGVIWSKVVHSAVGCSPPRIHRFGMHPSNHSEHFGAIWCASCLRLLFFRIHRCGVFCSSHFEAIANHFLCTPTEAAPIENPWFERVFGMFFGVAEVQIAGAADLQKLVMRHCLCSVVCAF